MDYKKIYDQLMVKAKSEKRRKNQGIYYEAHHIIPLCKGGTGTKYGYVGHPNIVLLTAREHYLAHVLLAKIYPDDIQLKVTPHLMLKPLLKKGFVPSARLVEQAKLDFNEVNIANGKQKAKEGRLFLQTDEGKAIAKERMTTNNPMKDPKIVAKVSETLKNKPKKQCPHCLEYINYRNYSRWHGDNCFKVTGRIRKRDLYPST